VYSKRAAESAHGCLSLLNSACAKSPSDQRECDKVQVAGLPPNGLIIRWSLVRVQPAPTTPVVLRCESSVPLSHDAPALVAGHVMMLAIGIPSGDLLP
jgi:hypothetical protein